MTENVTSQTNGETNEKQKTVEEKFLEPKAKRNNISEPQTSTLTAPTGDPVRDKCVALLIGAFSSDCPEDAENSGIISLCRSIEVCLFEEFGNTEAAYKAKFRTKYLNLKDKNNNALRQSLRSCRINAEHFCKMSAAEMASEERRRSDLALIEQNLREAKAAQDTEAETDQFRCGRCGQRRTKYYQLQTRSADEPMTTFVTCINCGNRWKFC